MADVACPKCGSNVSSEPSASHVVCGFCGTRFAAELDEDPPPAFAMPPKQDVCLALLEAGRVRVFLDPRRSGVVVPPQFRRQPQLNLDIGLNMPVPIHDLMVDEQGIACTLSFNRTPFYCVLPWASVYALVGEDERGAVWREDVPSELAANIPGTPQPPPPAKKVPHLVVVSTPPEPLEERAAPKARAKKKAASADAPAPKASKRAAKEIAVDVEPAVAKKRAAKKAAPKAPEEAKPAAKRAAKTAASETVESPAKAPKAPAAKAPRKEAPTDDIAKAPAKVAAKAPTKLASEDAKKAPIRPAPVAKKRELPPYLRVVK